MSKSSHSKSRVAHRGPRHETDPDRRVKYSLRFRRKGEEVEPQLTLVRRARKTEERQLAPKTKGFFDLRARRQDRAAAKAETERLRTEFNGADAEIDDEDEAAG
jgi:hypothetical protein